MDLDLLLAASPPSSAKPHPLLKCQWGIAAVHAAPAFTGPAREPNDAAGKAGNHSSHVALLCLCCLLGCDNLLLGNAPLGDGKETARSIAVPPASLCGELPTAKGAWQGGARCINRCWGGGRPNSAAHRARRNAIMLHTCARARTQSRSHAHRQRVAASPQRASEAMASFAACVMPACESARNTRLPKRRFSSRSSARYCLT